MGDHLMTLPFPGLASQNGKGSLFMGELILWLQRYIMDHSFSFCMLLYATGGKPAAFIAATAVGLNLLWFFPLIMIMDALQIPCFYYLYIHIFRHKHIRRVRDRLQVILDSRSKQRSFIVLKRLGPLGVLFLSMLPIKGGGIWSATLLAYITGQSMKTTFPLLIFGSLLSGLIFVGLGDGLLSLWHLIT
jgi:uncharacterized membrane protein